MEYVALYRKYRPKNFEELMGQDHVVRALKNSVINDRIAHAYLFCGTRGTGKTSCAKIYARAVNCLEPVNGSPCNKCKICKGILQENILDVVEIDAASNNSVDNIRELREDVVYAPSQAKYKVYIIDEVHMLSKGAFNALLKTLEEPPSHVIFILATTEPQKLPATILSRCQRFDFGRIPVDKIKEALSEICKKSEVEIEPEALTVIARVADGALRDAISILDQCVALTEEKITHNEVINIIGISKYEDKKNLVYAIVEKNVDEILDIIDQTDKKGINLKYFVEEFIEYLRNILVCILSDNPREIIIADEEDFQEMKKISNKLGKKSVLKMIKHVSELSLNIKWSQNPKVLIEVGLMDIAKKEVKKYDMDFEKRIKQLEDTILKGNVRIVDENKEEKRKQIKKKKEMIEQKEKTKINNLVEEDKKKKNKTNEVKSESALWNKLMLQLEKEKRMMIKVYLQNASLKKIGQRYALVFKDNSQSQKKSMEKEQNLSIIKDMLSKILGNDDILISCELESDFMIHKTEASDGIENRLEEVFKDKDVELEILE